MPTRDSIGKKAVLDHDRQVPYRLPHCDAGLSGGDADFGNERCVCNDAVNRPEMRNSLGKVVGWGSRRPVAPRYAARARRAPRAMADALKGLQAEPAVGPDALPPAFLVEAIWRISDGRTSA